MNAQSQTVNQQQAARNVATEPKQTDLARLLEKLQEQDSVAQGHLTRLAHLANRLSGAVPEEVGNEPDAVKQGGMIGDFELSLDTRFRIQNETEAAIQRLETVA